ncbi:DinB family protein [Undibacterium flavidum]|uniref:DinB family protein n=1 Tax=Undibacterium flavidum TaxID=2762297 RepID=A0ABR6Y869_9BURK|nr:DinB family protein [Undibacterium flavidum]MBC3872807.1 DinB family protein [Undibacterium flavidum]
MSLNKHVQLMAQYNQWMNQKLYDVAAGMKESDLKSDRGAFFGSIFATLNHIAVADTIWLKRLNSIISSQWNLASIENLAPVNSLEMQLFDQLTELRCYREQLDQLLLGISNHIGEYELLLPVQYRDIKGNLHTKQCFNLLMHVFNHQTHHRGQITTMLSQANIDIGVTDLNALIPELA